MKYSVKQLSGLAGVSIRTLRYYDQIGLLKPAERSEKGYRYYGREELLRLQQILFYRELDFPLAEIASILSDPSFDLVSALEYHKQELQKRGRRLDQLIFTIDKTISELKNQGTMMKDEEIYEGFSKEQREAMRKEVANRWGKEQLENTENNIRQLGKEGYKDVKKEGEEVNRLLAGLIGRSPADKEVQQAIARHHLFLNHFYEVKEARYRGLAKMYVEDERFRNHYEQYAPGLAAFIQQAVTVYCDNGMKVPE